MPATRLLLLSGLTVLAACPVQVYAAFDNTRFDNVAVYWGQNSYGATHSDTANFQKTLSTYCQDNAIDVIPIAFITTFFSTGGLPSLNLANTCNPVDNATFPGTNLANCASLASDIQFCQSKGKLVTLSLGGAGGGVGFTGDSQGQAFADTIWNLFLGGSSSTRPFGSAVLDGVDLDIEGGSGTGYAAFVNQIRSHAAGASKKYYITAAPQCVFPDASLGTVLNTASFDAVYVQFYNNPCGLQNFNSASNWDFGLWDAWARTTSPNPNVKIYIGAPASSTAAGGGYQAIGTLSSIAVQMRESFPSFGGVMLWDASQAFANGRYDLAIKNALAGAGGTGFTFPACAAPAFAAGSNYPGGSQVSFGGYVWQAKWFASAQPANNPNSDWSAISACTGSGASPTSSSSAPGSSPSAGSCAGVPAWTSTAVFTGGQQATFSGHLWTAKWWTQGDTPGGSAGVWTDDGACASTKGGISAAAAAATVGHAPVASTVEGKVSPSATAVAHPPATQTGTGSSSTAKADEQHTNVKRSRIFRA
ncbi:carbohydrate-binding module family 5 protein [Auriscalpium vulgare]|uniref:Carbohydrate-binding module family 5 protein n=1 Tax=Auriscalpium vulgare TaxID=40419 RepID=A0ACB8S4J7_9AGAM|nr:carbohydrate-binding module family 5 protein [Auriscalpium vulgare]